MDQKSALGPLDLALKRVGLGATRTGGRRRRREIGGRREEEGRHFKYFTKDKIIKKNNDTLVTIFVVPFSFFGVAIFVPGAEPMNDRK